MFVWIISLIGIFGGQRTCRSIAVRTMKEIWTGTRRGAVFFGRSYVGDNEATLFHPLLLLHPSVLKPNFHLRFVELQRGSDLYPSSPGQVLVVVKFLFEFCKLFGCEICSTRAVGRAIWSVGASRCSCSVVRSIPRGCVGSIVAEFLLWYYLKREKKRRT